MCIYVPVTGLAPRESLQWGERSIKAQTVIGEMDWTKKICPGSKVQSVMRTEWRGFIDSSVWDSFFEERSDLKVTEKPGKNKERKTFIRE